MFKFYEYLIKSEKTPSQSIFCCTINEQLPWCQDYLHCSHPTINLRCYQCITVMSYWVRWRLESQASRLLTQPFIRAQVKENIKAPRHGRHSFSRMETTSNHNILYGITEMTAWYWLGFPWLRGISFSAYGNNCLLSMAYFVLEIRIWLCTINSMFPGRCSWNLKSLIFKLLSRIDIMGISSETSLWWMPRYLNDDLSALVQVMVWCCQATSHYMNQCWPSSMTSSCHNVIF